MRAYTRRMRTRTPTPRRITSEPRLPIVVTSARVAELLASLPRNDSDPDALQTLLEANRELRHVEWPEPYNHTSHTLGLGDARQLEFLDDQSVHLVVTSPPYWTLK